MCSYPNLQVLVGAAGLDRILCAHLLNGNRRRAIADFNLSAAEEEAVLAVQADSLKEFARALLDWIEHQNENRTEADECAASGLAPLHVATSSKSVGIRKRT